MLDVVRLLGQCLVVTSHVHTWLLEITGHVMGWRWNRDEIEISPTEKQVFSMFFTCFSCVFH